ncbi:unnamed protein product [Staurois parvus]|uniref:Uncharacterized protein n=1 Tax=Staurois parvus TaxID=386267 RepID=A0ABN9BF50_9NEOB|nr:unnamed protein product [Staurois parvus]
MHYFWCDLHRHLCQMSCKSHLKSVSHPTLKSYDFTGRTDHLETRALPDGPGSVGGPMRCPWYLFS